MSSVNCQYFCMSDSQRHPLRPYLDYIGYLYQRMDPLPEQERFEVSIFTFVEFVGIALYAIIFRLTLSASYASLVTGIFYSHPCK